MRRFGEYGSFADSIKNDICDLKYNIGQLNEYVRDPYVWVSLGWMIVRFTPPLVLLACLIYLCVLAPVAMAIIAISIYATMVFFCHEEMGKPVWFHLVYAPALVIGLFYFAYKFLGDKPRDEALFVSCLLCIFAYIRIIGTFILTGKQVKKEQ